MVVILFFYLINCMESEFPSVFLGNKQISLFATIDFLVTKIYYFPAINKKKGVMTEATTSPFGLCSA